MRALKLLLPAFLCLALPAASQTAEDFGSWKPLTNPFPSTGGGGIMIHDYAPVVAGNTCRTEFSARTPEGARYDNSIEFDALPVQGGTLCFNGRWRAKDGSASGTTPFRVFIRDGVARGNPL